MLGPGLKSPHTPQEPRWKEEHHQFCSWLIHLDKIKSTYLFGRLFEKVQPTDLALGDLGASPGATPTPCVALGTVLPLSRIQPPQR